MKLTDFGTSCFVTESGVFNDKGTPGYRAPEVIRRQPYNLKASAAMILLQTVHKCDCDIRRISIHWGCFCLNWLPMVTDSSQTGNPTKLMNKLTKTAPLFR